MTFSILIRSAWRLILRHRVLSTVKLSGLIIASAVFLLTTLFAISEWSYDRQHHQPETIYRYVHRVNLPEGLQSFAFSQGPVAPSLSQKFSAITSYVRFTSVNATIRNPKSDVAFNEGKFGFADSTFFLFFNFPLRSGKNPDDAFRDPQTVILTPAAASKYFGEEDPVGKTLLFNGTIPLVVSDVFAEAPRQTHLDFDFLSQLSTLRIIGNDPDASRQIPIARQIDNKGFAAFYTYIRVATDTDPQELIDKFPEYIEETRGVGRSERLKPTLQPMLSIHLDSDLLYEIRRNGSSRITWVYFSVGLFVLILGCINYINISTAEFIQRARTTGLKKILGVTRTSLLVSHLLETLVLSTMSLTAGALLAALLLPSFNNATGGTVLLFTPVTAWLLLSSTLAITVLSGIYPALRIGATPSLAAFRGAEKARPSRVSLRNALVVFQLLISFALLTVSLLVYLQIDFLLNKTLGFDAAQVMVINATSARPQERTALKQQLTTASEIEQVGMCSIPPGEPLLSFGLILPEHEGEEERRILFFQSYVDADFLKVMGLHVNSGRFFDALSPADSSQAIVINEAGAAAIGGQVLNRSLNIPRFFSAGANSKEVKGLISDFHFTSLHSSIQPLVLEYKPERCGYLVVRVTGRNGIAAARRIWQSQLPGIPFDYYFLNEEFQNDYDNEHRLRTVVTAVAVVAIILAALGIFGTTLFAVQNRTREVAIRKVHGSGQAELMGLLFKPLLGLVIVATIAGVPLSWYTGMEWLSDYPYHTPFPVALFVISFAIILLVMTATIVYHFMKVISVNPAQVLKQES